jgi:hypothetical protein
MKLHRTTDGIDEFINTLCTLEKSFAMRHGTYTTKIDTENGMIRFFTTSFSNRVFIASQMIRKDIINCPRGLEIIAGNFEKTNFGNRENLQPFKASRILNIDISGAYGRCLFVNELITEKTYKYILTLKKDERLPAVGMLARSFTVFNYECGECTDIKVERSATAQVFFFLIQEIDNIMRACQWALGKHFFFYWVDGIFFSYDTPKGLVSEVENILTSKGYGYKFELVENFALKKKRDLFTIEMNKNGEFKRYQFTDSSTGKEITRLMNEKLKHQAINN